MLLSKATDRYPQREPIQLKPNKKRDKSGVWEEGSDGKANAGLLLRAKLLF